MSRLLKNLLLGAGRAFDLSGTYRKRTHYRGQYSNPKDSDFNALRMDWERVGGDIRTVMNSENRDNGER